MRPSASLHEAPPPRSRKSSLVSQTAASNDRPTTAPVSFFLTRGLNLDDDDDDDGDDVDDDSHSHEQNKASVVRTLQQTIDEATPDSISRRGQDDEEHNTASSRRRSTIKASSPLSSRRSSSRHSVRAPTHNDEHSPPPTAPTSDEPSLPSSPKSVSSRSLRRSDEESPIDDNSSQAIASSEDGDGRPLPAVDDSAPQLIMPSIKMPSRRPFTARGKTLGRYKILVTGRTGSGKTSLIKSIVQLCEDIVHVDPLHANPPEPRSRSDLPSPASKRGAVEIYASTKPYPEWWSEIDESKILRRRKSMGDSVLERNICFVEIASASSVDGVTKYLERQLLNAISAISGAGPDLTGLLSGRGGGQVDVILYLLAQDTFRADCERIAQLAAVANVVPLIAKGDLLAADDVTQLKHLGAHVPAALSCLPVFPSPSPEPSPDTPNASAPYTVSAAPGSDLDSMDASLLMSSEYIQPLIPSDLTLLVSQLFDPDVVGYLRHTAAKKLLTWHASHPVVPHRSPSLSAPSRRPSSSLGSPSQTPLSNSGILIPSGAKSDLSLTTSTSYALAKVFDHTQREERLAQIRLSKWASDLQVSLQRERERYEKLARREQREWLEEQQALVKRDTQPPPPLPASSVKIRSESHDPLHLLRWHDTVKTKGWIALQVVGGFGVVGGLALWLAKTAGVAAAVQQWVEEWGCRWGRGTDWC